MINTTNYTQNYFMQNTGENVLIFIIMAIGIIIIMRCNCRSSSTIS